MSYAESLVLIREGVLFHPGLVRSRESPSPVRESRFASRRFLGSGGRARGFIDRWAREGLRLGRMIAAACAIAGSESAWASMGKPAKAATYGQQVVAAVLMGEAWSEGEEAMVAVAEVIRARARASGSSPLAVVQQRYQFSCLNRTEPRKLVERFSKHPDFDRVLRIARRLYNQPDRLPGIARGATHFERSGTGAHWTQGLKPVARFGILDFYRIPSGA